MSESPIDLPLPAFRFEVSLEPDGSLPGVTAPICRGAFADCEGLEVSMEPRTVTPGGSARQVHLPGPVRYGQLTLRRGITTDTALWSWMAAAAEPGRPVTAHGEVSLWDAGGT